MLIKTNVIVLSKLKYRDNDLIVKCYTKHRGLVSYILRGVLKSRKGSAKTAYFQPLTQLQVEENYRPNQSLQTFKEVKPKYVYESINTNVLKGSVAMFLSEVLSNTLKEEEKNDLLFEYLETTLLWLDNESSFSNFHLLFLLNLTKHLGFYPQQSNIDNKYFNLSSGEFEVNKTNMYSISGENLALLKQLLGINFDALNTIKLNSKQRQSFLNMILLYYELHLGDFKKPKSLTVFNQVFN
ncbi:MULTISPECIES: DNA repair protein RecO [Gaetbulibacter]|uniref:DNA repair protein RecO n=1 Tax=Gaetbulibacter TaxID=311207 RepID=UPI0021CE5CE6|nr:DNA repair protein RecO [Gaetbulibacter sp. NE]